MPDFISEHATGVLTELATYDTIPIPVPTEPELEAREIVLNDCLSQKLRFLKAISDLQMARELNAKHLFDNLPPDGVLDDMLRQYRVALNGLLAHSIKVATGQMVPPLEFVASPEPPAIKFTKKPEAFPTDPFPDLTNQDSGQADDTLNKMGYHNINHISVDSDDAHHNLVISQSPAPGPPVALSSPITLVIGFHRRFGHV